LSAQGAKKHRTVPPYLGEDYDSHWGAFFFWGKTVLDIGADYGSTVSYFLEKGAMKVIAVEPDADLFAQLVSNYGDDDDVVTLKMKVTKPDDFEELILRFSPDLIKTDCEGCETLLAQVDEKILEKVPEYLIETHDHISGKMITSQIEDLFFRIRYQCKTYDVMTNLNPETRDQVPTVKVVHAKNRWETRTFSEADVVELKNELDQLKNELGLILSERDALSTKTKYMQEELDTVKSSFGYRFTRFYSARIDRAFPDGTRRGEFKKIIVRSLQIALSEGVTNLSRMVWEKVKRRELMIAPTIPYGHPATVQGLVDVDADIRLERDLPALERKCQQFAEAKVSVIIPTKTLPADFRQTLERIRNQKGINDPEIVVLNSGGRDLSYLANDYKVAVCDVPTGSFSHGETRNQAAQMATGDYVVFMTDDAIPADPYLLHKMISVLASDSTIGAVTARQIPRSDADLMYCQAIWGHYRMLGLDRDRVVGSTDLDTKSPREKRSICQIDDVCSCFRRTQFLEHRYATDVEYAEDLELGIRLVQRGLKIAQLFTTGVIHSHNRTPQYWARRSYVDFKVLQRLLNLETVDFKSWSVESANDLLDLVMSLYRSLNVAINDLIASRYYEYDITKAFSIIRSRLKHDFDARTDSRVLNEDVSKMLQEIGMLLDYRAQAKRDTKHLANRYSASLGTFQEWLENTHKDLSSLEKDFVEALYKLFAVQLGDCFGQYAVYANKTGHHDERTLALDRYLSEGV
jgi:rhamnosyltransferase